jgi:hypothetical protein
MIRCFVFGMWTMHVEQHDDELKPGQVEVLRMVLCRFRHGQQIVQLTVLLVLLLSSDAYGLA